MGSKIKHRQERKPKGFYSKEIKHTKNEGSVDRKVRNNMRQKINTDDIKNYDWLEDD